VTAKREIQPRIDELMSAFLARRASAMASGQEVIASGEVEAYEAIPTQSVDPRQAWDGAVEVIQHFAPKAKIPTRLPAGWSALVNALPSATGLPMAVVNFPQSVRDLPALLQMNAPNEAAAPVAIDDAALVSSIESNITSSQPIDWLVAVGLMRLAGRFESALRFVSEKSARIPKDLADAWANEKAALAWQMGDRKQAAMIWKSLSDSAPVLFNRGMAELFAGSPAAACDQFKAAIAQLPESSSWHHLARLYLALAESR
jgi:tetratricopeptide (TPR) repeat protein